MSIIYIITLFPNDTVNGHQYDGIWGAYSSKTRAMQQVEKWIAQYSEKELRLDCPSDGTVTYYTDLSRWLITPVIVDGE